MRLAPFLLDQWLERFKDADIRYDLASSTGPTWIGNQLLDRLNHDERQRLGAMAVSYGQAGGSETLRMAIGKLYGVGPEAIVVTAGASEALHILFADAAAVGGNVVVPFPAFPPILELPKALGLEVRRYPLDADRGFALDIEAVAALIDPATRLVLVNSPHNPTGTLVPLPVLRELWQLTQARGATLVADEVYWPLAYEGKLDSAAALPSAIVVGSLSKAMSLSGLRIGWLLARDATLRERYLNAKMYFTISNSPLVEAAAEAALARSEQYLAATREQARSNLAELGAFLDRNRELIGCVRPTGGTTAFPWLRFAADSRPFCEALAREGVLVAPGDCFGMPRHFRVGFGASDRFAEGLGVLERSLQQQAATSAGIAGTA